jgi:hypothetical protein
MDDSSGYQAQNGDVDEDMSSKTHYRGIPYDPKRAFLRDYTRQRNTLDVKKHDDTSPNNVLASANLMSVRRGPFAKVIRFHRKSRSTLHMERKRPFCCLDLDMIEGFTNIPSFYKVVQ